MQSIPEISIDLTAQDLIDPPAIVPSEIDVDDILEFDPLLSPRKAANTDALPELAADDETIEIELTADQMDAMLSVRSAGIK